MKKYTKEQEERFYFLGIHNHRSHVASKNWQKYYQKNSHKIKNIEEIDLDHLNKE